MDQTPKQQVAEQLKSAKNFAITTGVKPTVDDVVSVIGLGLMLRKLGKHVNLIISQDLPKGLEFITKGQDIEKSAENTRDFVIEFDRSKVDKLRYKKEEDTVKIFLTPYKAVITKDDFNFSQGDYNIDVLVAIGVKGKEDIDPALSGKTRIMHDANVIGIVAGNEPSNLPGINWNEPEASSVSEMLVSISEALQGNLLDEKSSTALLAGIIASTDHFTNQRTTPKVMTMAAQLMATGANQQMIISELKKAAEISNTSKSSPKKPDTKKPALKAKTESDDSKDNDNEDDLTVQLESSLEKEFNISHDEPSDHKAQGDDSASKATPSKDKDLVLSASDDVNQGVLPPVEAAKSKVESQADSQNAINEQLKEAHRLAIEKNNSGFIKSDAAENTHEPLRSHQPAPLNQNPVMPQRSSAPAQAAPRPSVAQPATYHQPANQPAAPRPGAYPAPPQPVNSNLNAHRPINQTIPGNNEHINLHPKTPTLQPIHPATGSQQPPFHPPAAPGGVRPQQPTGGNPPMPGPAPGSNTRGPQSLDPIPAPTTAPQPPTPQDNQGHDLENARKAVAEAINNQQFNPAHHPLQSIGAQSLDDQASSINLNR